MNLMVFFSLKPFHFKDLNFFAKYYNGFSCTFITSLIFLISILLMLFEYLL